MSVPAVGPSSSRPARLIGASAVGRSPSALDPGGHASSDPVRVCVYDCGLVVEGTRSLLCGQPEVVFVECGAGNPDGPVDLALVGLGTGGVGPESDAEVMAEVSNDPWVGSAIAFSWVADAEAADHARAAGAAGLVSKEMSGPDLAAALVALRCAGDILTGDGTSTEPGQGAERVPPHRGAVLNGLSDRECEVLALIVAGQGTAEIAETLFLSVNSVKTYIRTLYRRIDVSSRTGAALWGIDHGFPRHPRHGIPISA